MFTFGDLPTYQDEIPFTSALSDDRRALTLSFAEGAGIEASAETAAIGTRSFDLVLPLVGQGRAEIEFVLQAGVVLGEGTTGTLLLSVNGQSAVADFVVDPQQTVVQTLVFVGEEPTECRILALLVVGRESQSANGDAFLNFVSLDAEVLPRAPGPNG